MQEILLVIQLIIALTLVGLILIQRSEGGALGMGGSGMMSARGSANFLTRATGIFAAAFLGLTLVLAILSARGSGPTSIFDEDTATLQDELAIPAEDLLADPEKPEGEDAPDELPDELPDGN